jgi:hypothetical protein
MNGSCLVSRVTAIGCAFATMSLAGILFTGVPARADIDVRISISNAPPAPRVVFRARPHERLFPGERVYVVDDPSVGDNDCFRYGGYYWMFREGYWYRSANWRRQFEVVHPRYVPAVFYRLPPARWKHHPNGPPGLTKRGDDGPSRLVKKRDDGRRGPVKKSGRDDDRQDGQGRR